MSRKVTKEQVGEIVRLHRLWREGYEQGGEQANLAKADLTGADLRGVNLAEADLSNAILVGANLTGADLTDADLTGANLTGAYLEDANLTDADLTGANLTGANLTDANLTGANLTDADLHNLNLTGANLFRANLADANLTGANLTDADLTRANLTRANLTRADLYHADLTSANLREANLEGANLTGTILEPNKIGPKTVYGRKRAGAKALAKVTEPMKIAAFKRTFPDAFETVKHDIGGGTLTPDAAKKLIDSYGMTWQITETKWTSELQRLSTYPNNVLQLNIDPALVSDEPEVLNTIEAIRDVSYRSSHPVLKLGLFTIGWVRYSHIILAEESILVEEVQSDLPIVRKGLSDEQFQSRLKAKGLTDEKIHAALDVMQPFVERFYYDALALVFDIAEKAGLRVEMLSYEQKQQFGSPRSLYEDLPKSMGMRKADTKIPYIGGKTWQISPNPIRRRGKIVIPKTWRRL